MEEQISKYIAQELKGVPANQYSDAYKQVLKHVSYGRQLGNPVAPQFICTLDKKKHINPKKICMVETEGGRYFIFVHMWLQELRKFEISRETYITLTHDKEEQ